MTAAAAPTVVYLKEGHVIGMTLPLNPDVETRWRAGFLERVNADGSPWQGADQYDVLSGPAGPTPEPTTDSDSPPPPTQQASGPDPDPDVPPRPRGNASRRDWAAYAITLGACTPDEADKLTRDELVNLTTPPEETPKLPGE